MQSNPITDRLEQLRNQWDDYTMVSEAPILKWNFAPDELNLLDGFIAMENDESGELPDLIWEFENPFTEFEDYGFQLALSLQDKVTELFKGAEEEEPELSGWQLPDITPDEQNHDYLLRCCEALLNDLGDLVENLALILRVSDITNMASWRLWLKKWMNLKITAAVKVVIIDTPGSLQYQALLKESPDKILSIDANLNMPEALNEIAEQNDDGSEEASFRKAFTSIVAAIGEGEAKQAKKHAKTAAKIAEKNGWPHLKSTIHMALGSGFMGQELYDDALKYYQIAEIDADEAIKAGMEEGKKIKIPAIFGQCSVLINKKEFLNAATLYEKAHDVAEEADDRLNRLEAMRMASLCYELAKKTAAAWEHGLKALDIAELMDEEDRKKSTLPHAGAALWRISRKILYRKHRKELNQRMTTLCGENWQEEAAGEDLS